MPGGGHSETSPKSQGHRSELPHGVGHSHQKVRRHKGTAFRPHVEATDDATFAS